MPARRPPKPDNTSRIVLIAGAVIVVALIGFSITRALRPAPIAVDTAAGAQQSVPPPATPSPAGTPPSTAGGQLPPMASTRTAQTSPAPGAPQVLEEREPTAAEVAHVPRSKPEDVLQKFEAKQVTLIDVRDKDSYLARHIPGALHIPLAYVEGEIPYLPKDKPIVTYCT